MKSTSLFLVFAVFLGIITGWLGIHTLAEATAEISISLLQLIALPLLFLSVISNLSGMKSLKEFQSIGKRVAFYTLLTTIIAAFIALALFLFIQPRAVAPALASAQTNSSFVKILIDMVPSNAVRAMLEGQVMGIMLIATLLGLATLSLPEENRKTLHQFFHSLFLSFLKIAQWFVSLMPIAIWAFASLLTEKLRTGGLAEIDQIFRFLLCVVAANLIQGLIVLPIFLKRRGISPIETFKGMLPALSVGFFSRSSNAALPLSLTCGEKNLKISSEVARFSFPLCSTINMNACAAFILTSVLFVATSHGVVFSLPSLFVWVLLATLTAVGNAGVPMGCYFMASALLTAQGIPLELLGLILPLYPLLDMLETAINLWSDAVVTLMVDRDLATKRAAVSVLNVEK